MELPNKKYKIIYVDPAWTYPKTGGLKNSRGMAKQFYKTMSLEEIKELSVNSISDENSVLFLWTTFPKIQEALEVIKSWGFTYHNIAFCWIKKTSKGNDFFGMGYWTRANPEICLLATKGKPKPICHSIRQLQYFEIDKHSKKPDKFRCLITELCGNISRIELFARQKVEGWDAWGNEVPREEQKILD